MRVISKEVRYSETGKGKLYCIRDDKLYVFTINNFSWSLAVKNARQLEESMKSENYFQGFKEQLIKAMKELMKDI